VLYALDSSTGKEIWSSGTTATSYATGGIAIDASIVLFASMTARCMLTGFRSFSREIKNEKTNLTALGCVGCSIAYCGLALAADWTTDGGDAQRTGWQKDETILTKDNVKKSEAALEAEDGQRDESVVLLHAGADTSECRSGGTTREWCMWWALPISLCDRRQYGQIVWNKHFTYDAPPGRGGGAAITRIRIRPTWLLGPGGSTDTPVIGPPDAKWPSSDYMTDGGGMLHTLDTANGEDLTPPFKFGQSKFALSWWGTRSGRLLARAWGYQTRRSNSPCLSDRRHGSQRDYGVCGAGGGFDRHGWSTTGDGNVDETIRKI